MVFLKRETKLPHADRPSLVLFADNYIAGGVDVVTFQLLKHYAEAECELFFITNWNNPTLVRMKENGLSRLGVTRFKFLLTRISNGKKNSLLRRVVLYLLEVLLFPWYVLRFSRILGRLPNSVVLCINGGYPGSTLIRAATVATKWPYIRGVCTLAVHSIALEPRRITRPIEDLIDRLVFRSADRLIGVSATCLNSLAVRSLSREVKDQQVIRNSMPGLMVPERVTSPSRPNSDGICFFMPCTYEFPKGHHIALKAFRQFLDSGHDGSLIFAGDDNGGYRNEVQNLIKSLNLTDKVTLLEHQHDISSLYESCDVVLAPYLGPESFCLTVLEGIANGRHVIASSIDAISELYSDCPSVVLVKPNSSEDLSLAMMSPNVFDRSLKNLSGPEIVNFLSEFDSEFMFSKYDQVLGINL